eukprot:324927-Chlamydomonas_euryale.AAC.1
MASEAVAATWQMRRRRKPRPAKLSHCSADGVISTAAPPKAMRTPNQLSCVHLTSCCVLPRGCPKP